MLDLFGVGIRGSLIVVPLLGFAFILYGISRARLRERNVNLEKEVEAGSRQLREHIEDFDKAREIQQALLPSVIQQIKGCDIAGTWQPARTVGGDYFDVIRFSDSKAGICIADVVGKGVSAALLMANLQATVRAFARENTSPAEVCQRVNQVICQNIISGKFITFFYALIDTAGQRLVYANAGHNAPLLVRGTDVIKLEEGGALLGVFPAWEYSGDSVALRSGDLLVLYTDGITEAANTVFEEFDDRRLMGMLQKSDGLAAREVQERIMSAVSDFCSGNFADDATLLVLRFE